MIIATCDTNYVKLDIWVLPDIKTVTVREAQWGFVVKLVLRGKILLFPVSALYFSQSNTDKQTSSTWSIWLMFPR